MDLRHLALKFSELGYDAELLPIIHVTPYFVQLNTRSLFHDDVLNTHWI
jgi:hypothetical protein